MCFVTSACYFADILLCTKKKAAQVDNKYQSNKHASQLTILSVYVAQQSSQEQLLAFIFINNWLVIVENYCNIIIGRPRHTHLSIG